MNLFVCQLDNLKNKSNDFVSLSQKIKNIQSNWEVIQLLDALKNAEGNQIFDLSTIISFKSAIKKIKQDEVLDETGANLLILCAKSKNPQLALLILDCLEQENVNINFKDTENGATALHYACYFNHSEIIEALISKGADPLLKTSLGNTSVDIVVKNRRDGAIFNLIKNDPNLLKTKDRLKLANEIQAWLEKFRIDPMISYPKHNYGVCKMDIPFYDLLSICGTSPYQDLVLDLLNKYFSSLRNLENIDKPIFHYLLDKSWLQTHLIPKREAFNFMGGFIHSNGIFLALAMRSTLSSSLFKSFNREAQQHLTEFIHRMLPSLRDCIKWSYMIENKGKGRVFCCKRNFKPNKNDLL